MLSDKFSVLNGVGKALRNRGVEFSVDAGTICIGRSQWDKFSRRALLMLSAAPKLVQGQKSFQVFASEQYGESDEVVKYAITLCDDAGRQLKAWDLDTKRGRHTHLFPGGVKDPRHSPFSGSYTDIAAEIVDVMRVYNPTTGRLD